MFPGRTRVRILVRTSNVVHAFILNDKRKTEILEFFEKLLVLKRRVTVTVTTVISFLPDICEMKISLEIYSRNFQAIKDF